MSDQHASSILVASDEADNRKRWKAAFESAGFAVVQAENRIDALTLLRDAASGIDLLVTSVMRDGAGALLASEAGGLPRALPVIIVSGYAYPVGVQHGFANLLEPVSDAELIDTARALLSQ